LAELVNIAESIAREAGALLREYYHRGVTAEYKGDVDLVTEADRASEKLIVARLKERLPEHGVYGEEGTRQGLDSEFRWYIDPLDGTTNFAHGFPAFCVVLGCEQRKPGLKADEDGVMVAGVVYDPLRDEMFSAAKGEGAWLKSPNQPEGRPIHVSKTKKLQESLVATGFPSQKRHLSPNVHFYQEFTLRSHGVRRAGSAALDLAYVACGRLEAFWEIKLNPWDTSAGYLLVVHARQPRGVCEQWADSCGNAGVVRGYVCRQESGADPDARGVCGAAGGGGISSDAFYRLEFESYQADYFPRHGGACFNCGWMGMSRVGTTRGSSMCDRLPSRWAVRACSDGRHGLRHVRDSRRVHSWHDICDMALEERLGDRE